MTKHISVAGKGGTGKTTLAALIIRYLRECGKTPILAVDADPNANLNEVLGLQVTQTIATILAETKGIDTVPTGMTKDRFVEYRLSGALVESRDVDMLVMGGPEGPGCYCYPNELLRNHMDKLSSNYRYLVMDNEAGLEHLSRRVAQDVDVLFVTSDPTVRGIRSAERITNLARSLSVATKEIYLVLTMAREGDEEALKEEIGRAGLELAGSIPFDENVARFDLEGRPVYDLPADSPAWVAVRELADRIKL